MEALRHACVDLVRIEQDVHTADEPSWKLDEEVSTDALEPLRSSFCEMEREPMLRAAHDVVRFFHERAPVVARAKGLPYPATLDALISGHLEHLLARR